MLARGVYILGPEVRAFEQELASYLGVRHVIGVGNGTDAITIGLRALGVNFAQGYLIGRPVPMEKLEDQPRSYRPRQDAA